MVNSCIAPFLFSSVAAVPSMVLYFAAFCKRIAEEEGRGGSKSKSAAEEGTEEASDDDDEEDDAVFSGSAFKSLTSANIIMNIRVCIMLLFLTNYHDARASLGYYD